MRALPFFLCLLPGCKKPDLVGACKAFVVAANACTTEHADAKSTKPTPIDESLCDADVSDATNDQLQEGVDRYECKLDVFAAADCASDEGFTNAFDDAAACDGPVE